jgi:MGT family glycosyltransferase
MEQEAPDWLPADGRPLVYVTFGTLAAGSHRASQIYNTALQAVADLPVNVLMTTGRDAPEGLYDAVPPNVEIRAFAPQAQVLAHAALMVCHGGSGTVLGGLEAGVPMVIAPLFADQPDNARCLQGAGLCLSVEDADAAKLRDAITTVLADEGLHRRVELAARDIAAMPTLDQALNQLLKI